MAARTRLTKPVKRIVERERHPLVVVLLPQEGGALGASIQMYELGHPENKYRIELGKLYLRMVENSIMERKASVTRTRRRSRLA